MNIATITGEVLKDAVKAFTPGAFSRGKLVFDVMVRAEGDAELTPWHCEIEEAELMQAMETRLHAGTPVMLQAQLAGRPFKKGGVATGFVRYLKVREVKIIEEKQEAMKPRSAEVAGAD